MKRVIKRFVIFQVFILLMFFLSSCDAVKNIIPSSANETLETTSETVSETVEETTVEEPVETSPEETQEPSNEEEEEGTTDSDGALKPDEPTEHLYPEFFEISWLTGMGARYYEGGWDELLLEEKYNVDFKVWNIHNNDRVGLQKMLAAGDIPDVGLLEGSPLSPKELYENGFTRLIHYDFISEHFPYYFEKMLQNRPYGTEYNRVGNSLQYYGLSVIDNEYLRFSVVPVMRLDWLESIGKGLDEIFLKKVTLSEEPYQAYDGRLFITNYIFDHDALKEIFKGFTVEDPDGNGRDDTYGAMIWPHNVKNQYADLFWGQFGIISSDTDFLYRDWLSGDVVPYYAHAGYMDYMEWADLLRKNGYVRGISENSDVHDLWMNGKTGFFTAELSAICNPENAEDPYIPQGIWKNVSEDATFVILPALKGPERKFGAKRSKLAAMSEETGNVYTFGKDVSDEKLARIFTIWNDYYKDPYGEFSDKIYAGVEGVHYTWSGEPYNSTRISVSEDQIPDMYRMGKFWIDQRFGEEDLFGYEAERQILTYQYKGKWMKKYSVEPYKYINEMQMGKDRFDQYTADYESVREQIEKIVNDFSLQVWNGRVTLTDARWDDYILKLYEAGLRNIIDTYYNSPDFPSYRLPDFEGALRSLRGLK